MRLKSIYVEGFKSYATATVIGEFDPSFNAITGLNGSGKSNILDAICFAMGITTLSSVRVANLQELIYKQGTAGITKASVTLVFDNSDRNQSPTGYEADTEISVTRQIAVSAPCKYMINGRKALATEVSNMFRSVQLNVNNPHFLIMQGRITKVLNMKPEEIRDMLQEALGTLMYETKKLEAQKKMAQKEVKVQAINETLEKQITPRVEKLREDKKDYDRFNAVVQDMQRHRRFLVAYEFHSRQETSRDGRKELIEIADKAEACKTMKKTAASDEKNSAKEMEDRKKKRDQEASQPFKAAEEKEREASQKLVRVVAERDAATDDLKAERANLAGTHKKIQEVEQIVEKSAKNLVENKANAEAQQAQVQTNRVAVEKARQGVESAETGSADMIQEELMQTQKREQALQTAVKMSDLTIKTKQEERKRAEKEHSQALKEEESNKKSFENLGDLEKKVQETKKKLDKMSPVLVREETGDVQGEMKRLRSSTAAMTVFKYDEAGVGGEKNVFGRLASLVRLEKTKAETHARAMEVAAGGKLYQVVVDTKETSKKLLKNGKLQQRVTVVPLDSIHASQADDGRVAYAASKAKKQGGWCVLALDLLEKDAVNTKVWPAMQYAFGQTLICDTATTAKTLVFDDKIKMKCVTLEGDLFDPSGTLTGGSRSQVATQTSALFDLFRLHALEVVALEREKEDREMEMLSKARQQVEKEMEKAQHELEMALARNAETKSVRLGELIKALQEEVEKCERERDEAKAELQVCVKRSAELKDAMKNSQASKQKFVQEAKKNETAAKKALKESEDKVLQCLKLVEQAESCGTRGREELVELGTMVGRQELLVQKAEDLVKKLEGDCTKKSEEYHEARLVREEKERSLQSWDLTFQELENSVGKASEKSRELEMEVKRLDARQFKLKQDVKQAEEMMVQMKKEHLWIEKEQQFFGKAHTEYDFEMKDPVVVQQKYRELEEVQAQLSRSINKKALAMMEKAEEEYDSLDRKRRTIETDRLAIERVIVGLDRKKNEALVTAYEKVNKDFGSIFSTLLPGARAELKPVEGGTVLDGLEVRVAFGQTWKESLAELSGGQRSLLALSLVLALLRFKPAPLYILDEIDAALDLSHTQNIGVMLRTHFSESQFIVVSLKEGMFANASCLFRTKFVDGVSTVTRTVNKQLKDMTVANKAMEAKAMMTKAGGGKKRTAEEAVEEEEN